MWQKTYSQSFFPSAISGWNNLENETKLVKSKNIFKQRILNKIRPTKKSFYGISNDKVKYLTMLRVGLSPLKKHKFDYNFSDTNDSLCGSCGAIEDTEHYLLHCPSMRLTRNTLEQELSTILDTNFSELPRRRRLALLLFGDKERTLIENKAILNLVGDFIIKSKRLDDF